MDDQGVISADWRVRAKRFQHVPWNERHVVANWLVPHTWGDNKVDWRYMMQQLREGKFDLWRLLPPASGLAVTVPLKGRLFIYHLHGIHLFDTLTTKDLLTAATEEGLSGVMAETENPAVVRILQGLGFRVAAKDLFRWTLELTNG